MLYFSRWKIIAITLTLIASLLIALPNALSPQVRENLPGFMPRDTINLGLDLQGGAHMLLEVDVDQVIEQTVANEKDNIAAALRVERIRTTPLAVKDGGIVGRFTKPEDVEAGMAALRATSVPISAGSLGGEKTTEITQPDALSFRVAPTEAYIEDIVSRTIDQSIDVLRGRIDPTGTTEMTLAREGGNRILLQVPGAKNVTDIKKAIEKTANMTFHLVVNASSAEITRAVTTGKTKPRQILRRYQDGTPLIMQERPIVTGKELTRANEQLDQDGRPVVGFVFNTKGARAFGKVTTDHLGERFAVVLDDVIISAPTMRVPILSGSGVIEGGFTIETAADLAKLLNAGALPAKLKIVEERTVGAELGEDSIKAGKIAAMIGLAGVAVFMFLMYGFRFGLFANLALTFNIILIAAALSVMGATLTLPGIAGIILTIGMAVDANVLIFERIREEYANGRPPLNAIDTGYRLSLAPILDANITTLIAALTLYFVGSGPIRGFAVTLAIGIVMSVFTAVVVARLFTAIWHKRTRPKTLPI